MPGHSRQLAPVHWLRQFGGVVGASDGWGVSGASVSGIGVLEGSGVTLGLQFGYDPVASDVHAAQSADASNIGGHVAHDGPVHALRHLQVHPVWLVPDAAPLLLQTAGVHFL